MTGQLEDRWQPVIKRVCCVNPNTSDPVFLTISMFQKSNKGRRT
jgi:hypothetical protein